MMDRKLEMNQDRLAGFRAFVGALVNPAYGRKDTHVFDRLWEDVGLSTDHMSLSDIQEGQKVVVGVVEKLTEIHGHVPRGKAPYINMLGQMFFINPFEQ